MEDSKVITEDEISEDILDKNGNKGSTIRKEKERVNPLRVRMRSIYKTHTKISWQK